MEDGQTRSTAMYRCKDSPHRYVSIVDYDPVDGWYNEEGEDQDLKPYQQVEEGFIMAET